MENIRWLGHDSFELIGDKKIFIDPYEIESDEKADIILITHTHYDHLSVKDIQKLSTKDTTILVTPDGQSKLNEFPGKVHLVEPDRIYDVQGIRIESVRAYNVDKAFHPKENDWVGYIINFNGKRIYHAGDTDFIPEMKDIQGIDIALLPVSGTYVMTAEEAAKAAAVIKPKIAVPMHYGKIVGTPNDALKFAQLFKGETVLMKK